jgi:hypothetical protein
LAEEASEGNGRRRDEAGQAAADRVIKRRALASPDDKAG